jgi:probable HAF family extracellular repeat protein
MRTVPLVLLFTIASSSLVAAPSYTVRDLLYFPSNPSGDDQRAWGVNASGEITGKGRIVEGTNGYRTPPGGTMLNATQLSDIAEGWDINARGEIAGTSSEVSFGATLTVGTTTMALGNFSGTTGGGGPAYALNNLQFGPDQLPQVVGFAHLPDGTGNYHAFLWQAGTTDGYAANPQMRDLGSIVAPEVAGQSPYDRSQALSINDAQQVVGWSYSHARYAFQQGNPTIAHAFLWTADGTLGPPLNPQMRDLGTLGVDTPGQENHSQAFDINELGQVTGFSATYGSLAPTSGPHPFIWSEATGMVDINLSDPRDSYGFAINNHGDVVGKMRIPDGTFHAFVYTEGQIWDLNDLIPPGSGWNLMEAHDINDDGEIVGWGQHEGMFRAFALTADPPPGVPASSTLTLVALGLLLLAGLAFAARGAVA